MASALFTPDGDLLVPSAHTRGPWSDAAQHGGPPAALLARAMEALPADVPMVVARFTVEILRPVPLAPLRVAARIERGGRRVQLLRATLHSGDGDELCRASAWRLRTAPLGAEGGDAAVESWSGPDASPAHEPESDSPAFHRTGVELRFARGAFWDQGPSTVWIRLRRPVVEGEEPSPLMRVVAAADFGNGVSAVLEWGRFLYINTDLTVYMHREAAGEWICLDARTITDAQGIGVAQSALHDERGPFGRSLQTLLLDRLPSEQR